MTTCHRRRRDILGPHLPRYLLDRAINVLSVRRNHTANTDNVVRARVW